MKDLVKTVMELKQQVEIVTSTVNTLANQKTIIDGSCCDLPDQVKLPVKTFKEMDELEELLKVATTQQAMVRTTLSIYFTFFAFNFNVNVLLAGVQLLYIILVSFPLVVCSISRLFFNKFGDNQNYKLKGYLSTVVDM